MIQALRMLASYVRVLVATTLTVLVAYGHVPATPDEWRAFGFAALFSLVPVILRWLNPNDPAYGMGSNA